MKLYGFPPSPNTWKVRAVAAHIGIPLELALVDLSKGQQRTPEYLALNPTGRTPTLVDGDLVLWESTAIMHYLANQKPNSLWPNNPRARADIMRWQSWQLQHWSEACVPMVFQRLVKKLLNLGPPDAAVVEKATECFHDDGRRPGYTDNSSCSHICNLDSSAAAQCPRAGMAASQPGESILRKPHDPVEGG